MGNTPRKRLTVGIIDLVAKQSTKSIYARIVNPNYTSIMTQAVAVWAEEMGHQVHYVSFTGFEDLNREMPQDIDILFISTFSQAAYIAYSISNIFRQKNVVTVLGGPHARSFADDAIHHFDYVIGMTDKSLIHDLLADFSPNPHGGIFLSTLKQPQELPSVRERWKFIQHNLNKSRLIHVVPMIGSLGCPYECGFCIDAPIDYQTLSFDQIREDLSFLASQPKPPIVSWYDPNFGVRFDEYLDLIESSVKPGTMSFGAETSLSFLSEKNLKRLKKNKFIVILPGIESWFSYNEKSKQKNNSGMAKVKSIAEQINTVLRHVPYVQTNHIFGLDSDSGPEPFELTKRFIDLTPGIYPTYMMLTSFGNSAPSNQEYQEQGRVLDIPFSFLDGNSALNVRPKNYSYPELYQYMSDLARYSFSPKRAWRRFVANKHPLPRWMNLLRVALSGKGAGGNYSEVSHQLETDPEFQAFYSGESMKPPSFYHTKIRESLGAFYDHLPARTINYLNHGEASPNPRISNALTRKPDGTMRAQVTPAKAAPALG